MTNEQPVVSSQTDVKWRREINVRACTQKRFNWGWFNTFSLWRHIIIHYCSVKEWIWTWRNDLIAFKFQWHLHWRVNSGFKHLFIVPCDVISRTRIQVCICMRQIRFIQNGGRNMWYSGSWMCESSVIVLITRNDKYGRFGYTIRIRPVIVQRQWRFHTKFHSIAPIASSVFQNFEIRYCIEWSCQLLPLGNWIDRTLQVQQSGCCCRLRNMMGENKNRFQWERKVTFTYADSIDRFAIMHYYL